MRFPGKWNSFEDRYKAACLRHADDLSRFKQDPDYHAVVGNDQRGPDVVEAFDSVVRLPYVEKNDIIGRPKLHNNKSAGTLRYMKVVQDLEQVDFQSVVEIGGGYGGQCLVMSEFRDVHYSIIDIPEALLLARSYLEAFKIECNLISSCDVPELTTDLFLSDFCLGEFDRSGIDFYISRVKAKTYYITCNETGLDDVRAALLGVCHKVKAEIEIPRTSRHRNFLCVGNS